MTVPQTDTGRWVEYTKGIERTFVKELGKFPPYVRNKGGLWWSASAKLLEAAVKWLFQLFNKNTGLC